MKKRWIISIAVVFTLLGIVLLGYQLSKAPVLSRYNLQQLTLTSAEDERTAVVDQMDAISQFTAVFDALDLSLSFNQDERPWLAKIVAEGKVSITILIAYDTIKINQIWYQSNAHANQHLLRFYQITGE